MSGGRADWDRMHETQDKILGESRQSSMYSKIAAITGIVGLLVGLLALFIS